MIRRALAFYFLTIVIGSFIRGAGILFDPHLEWESFAIAGGLFFASLFIATLFSFPTVIIAILFYAILHFVKPGAHLYYIISGAFGVILISAWMFLLGWFFRQPATDFAPYWWTYGIASVIAGLLVSYLHLKGYLQSPWKDPRKVY